MNLVFDFNNISLGYRVKRLVGTVLLVLVPLAYGAFSFLPSCLVVTVSTPTGCGVVLRTEGDVEKEILASPSDGVRRVKVYLPTKADLSHSTIALRDERSSSHIVGIEFQRSLLFRFRFANADLERGAFAGLTILGIVLMVGGLIGAFLFSLMMPLTTKVWTVSQWENFIVALLVAFFLAGYVPVSSLLANKHLFDLSSSALLCGCAKRFALVLAAVYLLSRVLSKLFSLPISAFFLSFVVCGYLECGILSIGLPELTGDMEFLNNRNRSIVDALVLCFACVGCSYLFLKSRTIFRWSCGIVFVMVTASFCDIKPDAAMPEKETVSKGIFAQSQICKNIRFSTKGNILFIILDSLSALEAHEALYDKEFSLKNRFQGFTEFVNNVGQYHKTKLAMAALFTGEFYDGSVALREYFASYRGSGSVIQTMIENGADVYLVPGCESVGFTTDDITPEESKTIPVMESRCFDSVGPNNLNWSLDDLMLFRLMPFGLKNRLSILISQKKRPCTIEASFDIVKEAPFLEKPKKSFIYIHAEGTHVPIYWNRYGQLLNKPSDNSFEGGVEAGIFVLRQLADFLTRLKSRGLYDKTLIVVAADHGPHWEKTEQTDCLPLKGRPCLWIKPAGATNEFLTSECPTYHGNIKNLFLSEMLGCNSLESASKILSEGAENRSFRILEDGVVSEWIVNEDGVVKHRSFESRQKK